MKTRTRILGILVSLVMLLSALITCIAADTESGTAASGTTETTPAEKTLAEQLGWTPGTRYTGTTQQLSIVDSFGATGNKSLHIEESDSNWCSLQILPAEKFDGVTKYSVSAKMMWTTAKTFAFRFGDYSESAQWGDFCGISWSTKLWNVAGGQDDADTNYTGDKIAANKAITLKFVVEVTTGTIEVFVDGTSVSKRTNGSTKCSGLDLLMRAVDGYIDDLVVTNELTGAEIYKQDFEAFTVGTGTATVPTRPAQDYTGKKAGEVVFSDNYDKATSTDELYYSYPGVANNDFSKATWELSDKINGTNCAKISGNWSQVEIIPAEAVTPYRQYTIHMTLMFESNNSWFTVFYNTKTYANNQNSGFFALRYSNPVMIQNYGILNGVQNKVETSTKLGLNQVFELALSVDCDAGNMIAYIDGEYVSFVSNIYTEPSAVYIVAQSAVGYVDNVMITAGSYADYVSAQGGGADAQPGGDDQQTGETPTGDAQKPETPTTAEPVTGGTPTTGNTPNTSAPGSDTTVGGTDTDPAEAPKEKGCSSSVTASLPVVLLALGGAALIGRKRKQDEMQ